LLDVRTLDQNGQAVARAGVGVAAVRRTRDVGAAGHADAGALVLAQQRAGHAHRILLRGGPFGERRHRYREGGGTRIDGRVGDEYVGQGQHVFLDRLDELFGPRVARAPRQAHADVEVALIVVGDELFAHLGRAVHG